MFGPRFECELVAVGTQLTQLIILPLGLRCQPVPECEAEH